MDIRKKITHNLLNIPGWRTNRHIVVIESDDWGAIRMPDREVYDKLLSYGYKVNINRYERNDSLAREEDLESLFEVLSSFKDKNGCSPLITANCAVANPNFEKIKASNYTEYFNELFTETLSKYKGCEHSFDLWKEGIKKRLFIPQFHAREHLNVARWLQLLQSGNEDILLAFKNGMMGISPKINYFEGDWCQVAYDDSKYKYQPLEEIISEGLEIFEKIFGFKSYTSIAPCYTWNPKLERIMYEKGVKGIQGMVYQFVPAQKPLRHWMGDKNSYGQIYTIRNCFFEPSSEKDNFDVVDDCMYRIKCAFRWNKPAVISAHRLNFIGAIHPENRDQNLKKLTCLLQNIITKYPDVEFMSSDVLVKTIING